MFFTPLPECFLKLFQQTHKAILYDIVKEREAGVEGVDISKFVNGNDGSWSALAMMKKVVWCSFDGADSPCRQSSGCIQDLRAGTCTLVELDTDSSKIRSDQWPELTGQSFPVAARSLRGASASSYRGQAYAMAEER